MPAPVRNYRHLLKTSIFGGKKAKIEEVDEEDEDEIPANDKEDGKKGKKAKSKNCDEDTTMSSEGETDDEDEKEEGEEGESEEGKSDEEEKDEDKENDKLDKKKSKKSAEAERARCAAIFNSPYAAGQPDVAAKLAFHTNMAAEEAITFMSLLPKQAKRSSIDERMNNVKNPDVGTGAPEGRQASANGAITMQNVEKMAPDQKAQLILQAGRLRRGEITNINQQ